MYIPLEAVVSKWYGESEKMLAGEGWCWRSPLRGWTRAQAWGCWAAVEGRQNIPADVPWRGDGSVAKEGAGKPAWTAVQRRPLARPTPAALLQTCSRRASRSQTVASSSWMSWTPWRPRDPQVCYSCVPPSSTPCTTARDWPHPGQECGPASRCSAALLPTLLQGPPPPPPPRPPAACCSPHRDARGHAARAGCAAAPPRRV